MDAAADTAQETTGDGRRARRDRNRDAVVDAVVELVSSRNGFPALQEVADASGVSLRSVHRYFTDADAIVRAAFEAFRERHADTVRFVPSPDGTPFDERVASWVDHRLEVLPVTSRAAINAAARTQRDPAVGAAVEAEHRLVVDAIRTQFVPELAALPEPARRRAVAAVRTITSAEVWDNLAVRHQLAADDIRPIWIRLVGAALRSGPT